MTQATAEKVRALVKITRKNMVRASKIRRNDTFARSPFVESAAKYYPALKKLATR